MCMHDTCIDRYSATKKNRDSVGKLHKEAL